MIVVIDYGIGNVRSVLNALDYIGVQAKLSRDSSDISRADGLILPGVGAFGEGIRRLESYGLREQLTILAGSGKPLLGICLGFQMLMLSSCEQGKHKGLGMIDLEVVRLPTNARLPHIGWSPVEASVNAPNTPSLLTGLDKELFYFVHSYGVVKPSRPIVSGVTTYGNCEIIALVESGNIFGTQFHPEKSGEAGLQMLKKFYSLCS